MCIHTQADSTALHLACLGGHKEVIKMLVEDFSFPVNVRDKVWQSRMYVHAVQLCVYLVRVCSYMFLFWCISSKYFNASVFDVSPVQDAFDTLLYVCTSCATGTKIIPRL